MVNKESECHRMEEADGTCAAAGVVASGINVAYHSRKLIITDDITVKRKTVVLKLLFVAGLVSPRRLTNHIMTVFR